MSFGNVNNYDHRGISAMQNEITRSEATRIKWIDYYKAILIVLIVVGHATGKFNDFIYQFHVAAFFMISGYTSKLYNKTLSVIVIRRVLSLLVPYYFLAILVVSLFKILSEGGVLTLVSTVESLPGYGDSLITITGGTTYCDWLGASWFVLALFSSIIVQKIILILSGNKIDSFLYWILTIVLFLSSYRGISTSTEILNIDNSNITGIAQMYFSVGMAAQYFVQKKEGTTKKRNRKKEVLLLLLALTVFCLVSYFFDKKMHIAMNIANYEVNNPVIDIILALNGAVLVYCISKLMELLLSDKAYRVISVIGKNTLGIMFLHFIGFKVCTLVLYCLGIAGEDDFRYLTPPEQLKPQWWLMYVAIAIAFSVLCWSLFKRTKVIGFLTGANQQDSKRVGNAILNSKPAVYVQNIENQIFEAIGHSNNVISEKTAADKFGLMILGIVIFSIIVFTW